MIQYKQGSDWQDGQGTVLVSRQRYNSSVWTPGQEERSVMTDKDKQLRGTRCSEKRQQMEGEIWKL